MNAAIMSLEIAMVRFKTVLNTRSALNGAGIRMFTRMLSLHNGVSDYICRLGRRLVFSDPGA